MGTGRSAVDPACLAAIFEAGSAAQLADGQLLERFADGRCPQASAEAAFAALMARHGPMVLGVCRRALDDPRDVEDAFQAVFLVLVHKASTIRVDDTLGRWLYGVARRVASRACKAADRRRAREGRACGDPAGRPSDDVERAEMAAILDEELSRLPERYRAPLTLCYLEGLSNEEAARRLRCPIGTVQSRMARGRERLRARLARRGVGPAALLAGFDLCLGSARAAVPAALASSAIRSASSRATGAAGAGALALSGGVIRSMIMARIAAAGGVLGMIAVTFAGALAQPSAGPQEPPGRPPAPRPVREAPRTRVLRLADDRSLGVLYVRAPGGHRDGWGLADDPWAGWERLAEATGRVEVEAGRAVRLAVRSAACDDLSALRRLAPGDLTAVDFRGATIGREALAEVARLSGLRDLRLLDCRVEDEAVGPLADLASLRTLDLLGTPIGDAGLRRVASLPSLSRLNLGRTRVTEKGVALAAKMPSLRSLDLTGDEVGDAGLAALGGAPRLERLTIASDHYVTDAGLKHLARAANLRYLDLSNTPIGDEGLVHLAGLGRLEFLRISDTKVTDSGLGRLEGLTSLRVLLPPAGIGDVGLEKIGRCASLRGLFLSYGPVTDAGVAHLAGLKNLDRLMITGSEEGKVTDAAVASLAKLPNLKDLHLQLTALTDRGLEALAEMKGLEKLALGGGDFTWEGVARLNSLPELRELELAGVEGEPSLEPLRALTSLRRLSVNGGGRFPPDVDLAPIAALTKLEALRVSGTPVADEGAERLAGLTNLRELVLLDHERVRVGDRGLAALAGMRKLESLQVAGPITDRGLEHLARLDSLQILRLGSRTVSDGAIEDLKRRLPALQDVRKTPLRTVGDPPVVGRTAPDFEVETFAGERLRLSELRGRVVLLYFWATWCSPCVAATPEVVKFQERRAARDASFTMLSLSLDESDDLARRHAERHGLRWPQAWIGMDSPPREGYGVVGAPTYVLVDTDGKISLVAQDLDEVERVLEDVRRP